MMMPPTKLTPRTVNNLHNLKAKAPDTNHRNVINDGGSIVWPNHTEDFVRQVFDCIKIQ